MNRNLYLLVTLLLLILNSCSDKNQSDPQNSVNNKHLLISTTEVNFGSKDNLLGRNTWNL